MPKSSAAKQQTLLKKRRLSQSKLLIGRRGSIAELTASAMEDYLISQHEPYTVSKRQCLIEIRDGEVWLRDLKSRYGTVVNGRKIGGRNGTEKMEVRLRRGEHSLIPGPSASSFEFKIVVK
ncbi:MAG: FHA domain-containing protein [Opitutales bacterium]